MKTLVVDLYVEVFDFLCFTMQWYQSRFTRFKKAFNQNYASGVENKVQKIRNVVTSIKEAAEQATQARVKYACDEIGKVSQNLTAVSDQYRHDGIRTEEKLEQIAKQMGDLQQTTKGLLYMVWGHVIYGITPTLVICEGKDC